MMQTVLAGNPTAADVEVWCGVAPMWNGEGAAVDAAGDGEVAAEQTDGVESLQSDVERWLARSIRVLIPAEDDDDDQHLHQHQPPCKVQVSLAAIAVAPICPGLYMLSGTR
jgi:hypothetical protein